MLVYLINVVALPNRYLTLSENLGCETIAHIRENRRITFLFHSLDGPPRIVRFFGQGASLLLSVYLTPYLLSLLDIFEFFLVLPCLPRMIFSYTFRPCI